MKNSGRINKIGIVANTAFNIYNFRLGLMQFLKANGYEVIAIAPEDSYTPRIREAGFTCIDIRNLARKGTNPLMDLRLMNELRTIYSNEQIDVALQYTIKPNIYGTLAARLCGVRTICTVTGLGYTFLNKSLASSVARKLYRLAFRYSDIVLFQNQDDRQTFLDMHLVEASKTAIVPGSGIDTEKFHPGFCKEKAVGETTRFLMITRLLKDKGIYEYMDAARILLARHKEKVAFYLAGDLDEHNPSSISKAVLQQWITEGIIQYHGYVSDTRTVICQADCVVLPSYREGMPRVILEGMAMGKPCITTDVPGCRDSVDPSCGFLAAPGDAVSLAEQMQAFFDLDQGHRQEMSIAARNRAENTYKEDIIFKKYLDCLLNF